MSRAYQPSLFEPVPSVTPDPVSTKAPVEWVGLVRLSVRALAPEDICVMNAKAQREEDDA